MTAKVPANCWQNPLLPRRNASIASVLLPNCTSTSYLKLSRNQFCSANALSNGVAASAVAATACSRAIRGRPPGRSRLCAGAAPTVALRRSSRLGWGTIDSMAIRSPFSKLTSGRKIIWVAGVHSTSPGETVTARYAAGT